MGEMERKLAGVASAIYDILTAPDRFAKEERDESRLRSMGIGAGLLY